MKTETIKGYKFIQDNMQSKSGNCTWTLGEWKKHEGNIKLCESGLHACRTALQSLSYVYGNKWFIVEGRGKFIEEKGDKFVCSEMRLVKELPVKQIVVRFACACARRNLKNFEKQFPNDKRPEEAIKAAEAYLDNKINLEELNTKLSAAWSAAESAESAESAARSAARSAAESAESAESAAWSAAWSAARSAAESAESAESAAWSAARSAAWSAARSAAESAESAAWSARSAESAAWSARSAARSAERKWQEKEFEKIVKRYFK